MFGFNSGEKENTLSKVRECVIVRINARVPPTDRREYYEYPLDELLVEHQLGSVIDGRTQLADDPTGIKSCEVELSLLDISDDALALITKHLEKLGAPKGSKLIIESTGREVPFGRQEGIAVYLNGDDLPEIVYQNCDFDIVVSVFDQMMGEKGTYRGYWQGARETSIYCYGKSFSDMKEAILPFLESYPLCKQSRIEQIA